MTAFTNPCEYRRRLEHSQTNAELPSAPAVGRSTEKIMPHHDTVALTGTIQHVFAHRFTLEADGRTHLADLTPKGLETFPLTEGLRVSLEGERRPSEIKVTRIAAPDRAPVLIEHMKPHHGPGHKHPNLPADPEGALSAARRDGWMPSCEVRSKPKHFEVLARRGGEAWTELHIDFAGLIYKHKPADAVKWSL